MTIFATRDEAVLDAANGVLLIMKHGTKARVEDTGKAILVKHYSNDSEETEMLLITIPYKSTKPEKCKKCSGTGYYYIHHNGARYTYSCDCER